MPEKDDGKEDDDFGGRWREVRPKDFVKQFRIILTNERSAKVAKNILLDIAKKNNGKEGMFDMFVQRPNTLARILEKKTIDGNIVNRLKQQITDWIVYEEEKKRKWLGVYELFPQVVDHVHELNNLNRHYQLISSNVHYQIHRPMCVVAFYQHHIYEQVFEIYVNLDMH